MVTVLTAQFGVYAVAWLMGALFMREARQPALLWALYGLLQAAGLVVLGLAPESTTAMTVPAAQLMVLAYLCADAGLDWFVNGRLRHWRLWLGLLAVGQLVLLSVSWLQSPLWVLAVSYNLLILCQLAAPLVLMWRRFVQEFGVWAWLSMVPAAAMATLVLIRVAAIVAAPEVVSQQPGFLHSTVGAAATLVAAGAFNLCLLALIVGRLVLRLRRLGHTDALTEVTNRAGLEQRLLQAWQVARRHEQSLSVAFIDLDDFKAINDRAGHAVGDALLKAVAAALRQAARTTDTVGRWGGDEFLVLMPHTAASAAQAAALRYELSLQQATASLPHPAALAGITVGTATLRADDADASALIARADAEMYQRKMAKKEARTDAAVGAQQRRAA